MKQEVNVRDLEVRSLPRERAISLTIGGTSHAVMMASPEDLEDFAYGYLLSEGVIEAVTEVESLEIIETKLGIDLQIRLISQKAQNYQARRRRQMGPVGCGLCGIENLELLFPELAPVKSIPLSEDFPYRALETLVEHQTERVKTGALHASALFNREGRLLVAREDIGRHNAMDKVIGHLLGKGQSAEVALVSSRISLDLVIKVVRAKIPVLIGRATPSDLAVHYAKMWNLKLIAPVFPDGYYISGGSS